MSHGMLFLKRDLPRLRISSISVRMTSRNTNTSCTASEDACTAKMADDDRFNPFAANHGGFDEEEEGLYDEVHFDSGTHEKQGGKKGKEKLKGKKKKKGKQPAIQEENPWAKEAVAEASHEVHEPHDDQLAQREKQLNEREAQMNKDKDRKMRKANWPPCYAIIYHDINADIRSEERRQKQFILYRLWFLNIAVMSINWLAITIAWGQEVLSHDRQYLYWFFATIFAIFNIIMTWFSWYKTLYNAFRRKGKVFKYKMFLFWLGCDILFKIFLILGIEDTGAAGIVLLVKRSKDATGATAFFALNIISCVSFEIIAIYLWIWVLRYQSRLEESQSKKKKAGQSSFKDDIISAATSSAGQTYLSNQVSKLDDKIDGMDNV